MAEYITLEPDGTKTMQTWFVECKHHSIANPLSVADLQTKIAWADAEQPDYLLIITTSYLTPDTKDWVEKISKQKRFRIRYWEGTYLTELVEQYPRLKQIYLENRTVVKNEEARIRLLHEVELLKRAFTDDKIIVLEEILGDPPDRFVFGLKFEAIIGFDEKDKPIFGSYHRLMISISVDYPYPSFLPHVVVLTPFMSPHVAENGLVCYGRCNPFHSIHLLVWQVYHVLAYETFDLDGDMRGDPRLIKYIQEMSQKDKENKASSLR